MVHARSEDLKSRIAAVAASLFYAEGINRVGVDRIADVAGITKKTLYHHFPSKDQLIVEALRVSPIVLFPADGPPLERIRGAFEARLQQAGVIDATSLAEELDVLFDGALASGLKRGELAPVHAATRLAMRLLETASVL